MHSRVVGLPVQPKGLGRRRLRYGYLPGLIKMLRASVLQLYYAYYSPTDSTSNEGSKKTTCPVRLYKALPELVRLAHIYPKDCHQLN